ncbi:Inner membrane protein YdjM [Candidatus Liberibacter asiaticus]|nr:metal-dependent hydrolase [Candidatus Liberibacter asiaticus]KAE9517221.1 Inner membrane protein YdjM [Candidatus Liberibacter asiaticus]
MTYEGHCIFALASVILAKKVNFLSSFTDAEWGTVVLGALLSCLLPDIDHPRSFISKRFKTLSLLTSCISSHRGFTHSILAVILYKWLIHHFFPSELISYQGLQDALIIGYVSHLVADVLTPTGIPLLWPYHWRFCLPILHPNSPIGEIFF